MAYGSYDMTPSTRKKILTAHVRPKKVIRDLTEAVIVLPMVLLMEKCTLKLVPKYI